MLPAHFEKTPSGPVSVRLLPVGALVLAWAAIASPCGGDDAPAAKKPAASQKTEGANDAAAAKEGWRNLFDGKSLKGWKKSEFGGQGEVDVEEGAITLGFADGCTGVTWGGDFPKVDYEVSVEAKRVDGNDFFCGMTFPVQESPCSLIVGGWGGTVVGLSSIDGNDAANNDTTKIMRFEKGRWYSIRVRVTAKKIEAWIDNKQVVDQATEGHKIGIRSEVEASKPFGICSWCTTAALRNIRWRPLEKK